MCLTRVPAWLCQSHSCLRGSLQYDWDGVFGRTLTGAHLVRSGGEPCCWTPLDQFNISPSLGYKNVNQLAIRKTPKENLGFSQYLGHCVLSYENSKTKPLSVLTKQRHHAATLVTSPNIGSKPSLFFFSFLPAAIF